MQSKIERQVMAGVGTVYAARQLTSATALKLYVCVLALFGLGRLVWVSRVFENLAHAGLQNAAQFMLAAVLNTNFLVQVSLLVFVLAGVSLLLDLARSVASTRARFA